ncbi:thiol:disulfide interchange protein [Cytophagales bacterium WSM2-2]|nr:thiol:disulfide interchange protein [Cytophagales bacterium WSM2-2]
MKITLVLLLLSLAIYSCNTKENVKGYRISAEVSGFPDSTWFYLVNDSQKSNDSVMMHGGKFNFEGALKDSMKSVQVLLKTKDLSDYKFFWLENTDITFKAEKGIFRQATVTGSKAQKESDQLSKIVAPIDKQLDSVNQLMRDPKMTETQKVELNKSFTEINDRRVKATVNFVKMNPGSIVSVYVLSVYASSWGKKLSIELFEPMPEENMETSYGRKINDYITLNANVKIGDNFADFEQTSPDGEKIKLSDFKGKIVLLEFWAAWCGPCRAENPELVKTYKSYKDKGFEVLGVSLDDNKAQWIKAIDKDGLPWKNVSEVNGSENRAALMYGVSSIPDNFLIDKTGKVIDRNLRGEKLRKRLAELLK